MNAKPKMTPEAIHAAVFASLGTAKAEGFFDANQALHGMTAAALAEDLCAFDADFEWVSPHEVEPHCAAWLAETK